MNTPIEETAEELRARMSGGRTAPSPPQNQKLPPRTVPPPSPPAVAPIDYEARRRRFEETAPEPPSPPMVVDVRISDRQAFNAGAMFFIGMTVGAVIVGVVGGVLWLVLFRLPRM